MEQLTPLLKELADKLGTTVQHLWSVLIAQTKVEIILCQMWMGIYMWGGIGVVLLGIIILITMISKDADEGYGALFSFLVIVILIAGIGYYTNYSELLTLQNNPEFWALQEVLKRIGK